MSAARRRAERQVSSRRRRLLKAVLFLALFLLLLVVFYPLLLIHENTRRMPIPAVAVEFPHPLEPLTLRTRDGLQLAAWKVDHPTPEQGTMILLHGHNASKEFNLERGAFAYEQGFDLLLLDFRNHGESEGRRTTFGGREWMDVMAAIESVRSDAALSDDVVLWGCSQGAATALLAAERDPTLRAVIAESSFLSLEDTFTRYAEQAYRIPRFPFVLLSLFWFRVLTGVRIEAVDPARAVRNAPEVPILFIGSKEDRFMPPEVQEALYANSAHPDSALWISPRGGHSMVYVVDGNAYRREVKAFLSRVQRASGSADSEGKESSH